MSRVTTVVRMGTREVRRTPVLLALLVFLPAYIVGVFTYVAPDSTVQFELAGGEAVRVGMGEVFPAFTTPMVAALLSAIAGLFLMDNAARADSRLLIAGYRSHEVVLARLALLVGISAVGTLVAVGVMRVAFAPEHLLVFAGAVMLAALIYGMVGVLAGVLLDRLPGVYLILFGTMIDLFLFQNPMATDTPALATVMPGHYPIELAMDAGFSGTVSTEPLPWALAVLAVLTALATAAFYRETVA
ncbi:MAG: hypothetical protein ABEH88_03105 [Halobacteriales archaeon]